MDELSTKIDGLQQQLDKLEKDKECKKIEYERLRKKELIQMTNLDDISHLHHIEDKMVRYIEAGRIRIHGEENSGCLINVSKEKIDGYPLIIPNFDIRCSRDATRYGPKFPNTTLLRYITYGGGGFSLVYRRDEDFKQIEYRYTPPQRHSKEKWDTMRRHERQEYTMGSIIHLLLNFNARLEKIETHLKIHE